jgi:tetratricopeptide (TPR) repeat protein
MNAHLNLGVIKFKQGNVPMAIRNYNIELKKNSRCYEAHYNLGLIDLERKRWKSAVRHLERCWRNQHVAPELGEDLAWAAYNAGLLGLEETIYRRELRKNSRSVWALNNLAAICNHRGQHREARRLLEKALALSPRDSIVKDNLKHTPS